MFKLTDESAAELMQALWEDRPKADRMFEAFLTDAYYNCPIFSRICKKFDAAGKNPRRENAMKVYVVALRNALQQMQGGFRSRVPSHVMAVTHEQWEQLNRDQAAEYHTRLSGGKPEAGQDQGHEEIRPAAD